MHEKVEQSPDEMIEDIKRKINEVEEKCKHIKHRNPKLYEEMMLVVQSMRFYLENGAVDEFIKEVDSARELVDAS